MSVAHEGDRNPRVGDRVMLLGTRVVGAVARVVGSGDDRRVSITVTAVLGTTRGSKASRAWRGARVTCPPSLVATLA